MDVPDLSQSEFPPTPDARGAASFVMRVLAECGCPAKRVQSNERHGYRIVIRDPVVIEVLLDGQFDLYDGNGLSRGVGELAIRSAAR
jgi:hypothetical protein